MGEPMRQVRWPNEMIYSPLDGSHQVLSRARGALQPLAQHANHLPAGHPEGLHDAFAITFEAFTIPMSNPTHFWAENGQRPLTPGIAEPFTGPFRDTLESCKSSVRTKGCNTITKAA